MSALESACRGWSSKWREVCNACWIFIIWAITAAWLLPDVHVECVNSVHVVQCCYQTPPTETYYYSSFTMTHHHSTLHTPHIHTHTCTPHIPTAPLLPQANHVYQLINVKTTQSETDQTGNGFILQHVALSFVWRDPAVVSDCTWVKPNMICKQQRHWTLSYLLHLWLFHVVYNKPFSTVGRCTKVLTALLWSLWSLSLDSCAEIHSSSWPHVFCCPNFSC